MDSGISLGCMRGGLDTQDPKHILVLVLKGNHADHNVRIKVESCKSTKNKIHAIGKYKIIDNGWRANKKRVGKFRKF